MPNPKAKQPILLSLREDVAYQQPGQVQIDRAACQVRNLLLSGLNSKNGRTYLLEAYQAALPLYEGAKCNIDHPLPGQKETPLSSRFGIYRNVRLSNEGPRADLTYNPHHPMAETFLWWAEHCPEAVGLSHNADGGGQMNADGTTTVTQIYKIYSVDLVADPATSTRGLAEAAPMPPIDPLQPQPPTNPLAPTPPPVAPGAPGTPQGGAKPGDASGWIDQVSTAMKSLMMDSTMGPDDKWRAIEQLFNSVHPKSDDGPPGSGGDIPPGMDPGDKGSKPGDKPDKPGNDKECKMTEDDAENVDDTTMESLRRRAHTDPALKRLLESYSLKQTRDRIAKRRAEVLAQCRQASLPEIAINDVFLESLISAEPKQAQKLIEHVRRIATQVAVVKPTSAAPGPVGGQKAAYDAFISSIKSGLS